MSLFFGLMYVPNRYLEPFGLVLRHPPPEWQGPAPSEHHGHVSVKVLFSARPQNRVDVRQVESR